MRDYVKEGVELETGLIAAGVKNTGTLADMVISAINQSLNQALQQALMAPSATSATEPLPSRVLSTDQQLAWEKIQVWATNKKPYFVLRGFSGTGKSYLMQMLSELKIGIFYSATTNKAAKVLGKSVGKPARTTYSILGLRMQQDEEELVLTESKTPPYFPPGSILIVDECFVNSTLVDTPKGPTRIDRLNVGDEIINACGVDRILAVSRKKASTVVKIVSGKKTYWCSENHRFFTERGLVFAKQLRFNDKLVKTEAAMRFLQSKISPDEEKRFEKGQITSFERVDSVEILESGHSELDRFRDAEKALYLYDIQADRHQSFSVSGNLVHNCSMVGKKLCDAIDAARRRCNIKILYVGDPAQLPPIGEASSPVWKVTTDEDCHAMLKKIMRHDNQLLELSVALRRCIKNKDWSTPLVSDHDDTGVWLWKDELHFKRQLLKNISPAVLRDTKVIAWRNKTVDIYNAMIREKLGFKNQYDVGDIILLAEPMEKNGNLIAHVDDEFTINEISEDSVKVEDTEIATWQMHVSGDQSLVFQVPRKRWILDQFLAEKARVARRLKGFERSNAWRNFWEIKSRFNKIRYGYALTAHRAQGSSIKNCWVDQMDILSNSNKKESYRCLYVACTRATENLHSF